MSEHIHEWRAESIDYEGLYIACIDCREHLSDDEISRRLNATEKLSAEAARAAFYKIDALSQELMGYEYALEAYASALEGENESS